LIASFYCLLLLAQVSSAEAEVRRLPPIAQAEEWQPAQQTISSPPTTEYFDAGWDEPIQLPATSLNFAWLAGGNGNAFGMVDADLHHTWLLGYSDGAPLEITPGLGYHAWSGPRGLDLPGQVYDVYLDLHWRPIERERWGLSLGLTPGFYGDFERVDGDTFQLTGWALANYRLNEQWNVLGGLAYVRQLQSNLLPIGGVVWTPNDDLRLELVVPRPRFVRRFLQDEHGSTWWFIGGQLGGGAWAVADTPDDNVLVSYSDLRLLLGIESFALNGREWSVALGYAFNREIAIDNYIVETPESTFLLQGSVAF